MRILVAPFKFSIEGSNLMLFRLTQHLQCSGHDVAVMPISEDKGPLRDAHLSLGIPIVHITDARDFDLVIANTVMGAKICLALGHSAPVIWWIHEAMLSEMLLGKNPPWREAFHLAKHIVFQAEHQRETVLPFFPSPSVLSKTSVIPNPILPLDQPIQTKPKRLGCFRAATVGAITINKNQQSTIRAMAELGDDCDWEYLAIGPLLQPIEHAEAKDILKKYPNRVRILGELPPHEARSWLASADCLIHPAIDETQALSVFEAASLGVPLILSDCPAFREFWQHDVDCLQVSTKPMFRLDKIKWCIDTSGGSDITALARAISDVKNFPTAAKVRAERARQKSEQYQWPTFIARIEHLIEQFRRQ